MGITQIPPWVTTTKTQAHVTTRKMEGPVDNVSTTQSAKYVIKWAILQNNAPACNSPPLQPIVLPQYRPKITYG